MGQTRNYNFCDIIDLKLQIKKIKFYLDQDGVGKFQRESLKKKSSKNVNNDPYNLQFGPFVNIKNLK